MEDFQTKSSTGNTGSEKRWEDFTQSAQRTQRRRGTGRLAFLHSSVLHASRLELIRQTLLMSGAMRWYRAIHPKSKMDPGLRRGDGGGVANRTFIRRTLGLFPSYLRRQVSMLGIQPSPRAPRGDSPSGAYLLFGSLTPLRPVCCVRNFCGFGAVLEPSLGACIERRPSCASPVPAGCQIGTR